MPGIHLQWLLDFEQQLKDLVNNLLVVLDVAALLIFYQDLEAFQQEVL